MLRGLEIRDLLIIDHLELTFQPGLNVLTGETGAGKSILLDSLGFVLGWRGRAELVRSGAAQGEVTAWFDLKPGHPALGVLGEAGLPAGPELILRRINSSDGRKTAWINDRRASGEVLRALSETLVELHGQHDDRGLLNPRGHRAVLDEFAHAGAELEHVAEAWRARRSAAKALADAETAQAELASEEEFLRHAVAEFTTLDPQAGEDAELDARRRAMQGAERVRADIQSAHHALSGAGAEALVSDAIRWLDDAAEAAEGLLDGALEALSRVVDALGEAEQGVVSCLDAMRFDPGELESVEERLFALRALARKHAVIPDDLPALGQSFADRLAAFEGGAEDLARLQKDLQQAQVQYDKAAEKLTKTRETAARALDTSMAAELAPLKMERAVFETQVTAGEPGPEGRDTVAFQAATNPGAPSGALDKIASGGELSRFLLALKVCLSGPGGGGRTMIFDEIDRGVGGATADAVGRRLASIARAAQVLVVTHSPQVAALGQHHWRVEKRVEKEQTLSTVTPLGDEARVDELARMLSGDRITQEARAAAQALLAG